MILYDDLPADHRLIMDWIVIPKNRLEKILLFAFDNRMLSNFRPMIDSRVSVSQPIVVLNIR